MTRERTERPMPETPHDSCREACGGGGWTLRPDSPLDGSAPRVCHQCWNSRAWLEDLVPAIRSRRAAAKAGPEMYGTMPDVLPETVPAGTRFNKDEGPYDYVFTGPARLRPGGWYSGAYRCFGYEHTSGLAWPREIDWSSVPKQPPAEQVPEGARFKVGDWVEFDVHSRRVIGQVLRFHGASTVDAQTFDGKPRAPIYNTLSEKLRHWQPQPGEWCENSVSRGRFSRIDEDGDAVLNDSNGIVYVNRASLRPAPPPPAERVANETPAPATTPARSSGPPRAAENSGLSDPYARKDGLTDAQIAALVMAAERAPGRVHRPPAVSVRVEKRRDPADWDCWATPTWETG